MSEAKNGWRVDSWRHRTARHQPIYDNPQNLAEVVQKLSTYPPLVRREEVDELRALLSGVQRGEAFILQGGDCAERFTDCEERKIAMRLRIISEMAALIAAQGVSVVRIGRIAGQYAKPRTHAFEIVAGQEIPTFRGDSVHSLTATPEDRAPDPMRLEQGYFHAGATLNYLRALTEGMEGGGQRLFTSHEGLLLDYEQGMTRHLADGDCYYNLGAHMLWIGDRTRQLEGAHVEYFRGIANPVGIKVGPGVQQEELLAVVQRLNPTNAAGKIVLITRFGKGRAKDFLPRLLNVFQEKKLPVIWSVDPMHGNTILTKNGVKTRYFSNITQELTETFALHRAHGSRLGGVHVELTGEDVTECIGGSEGLSEADLHRNYDTVCDPRLNYSQSLELASKIAACFVKAQV